MDGLNVAANRFSYIKTVKYVGMEDVNIWEMYYTGFYSLEYKKIGFLHRAYRLLRILLSGNYDCEGKGKMAFVYTNSVGPNRLDHQGYFSSLCSLVDERLVIRPSSKIKLNIFAFRNLKYVLKWKRQSVKAGMENKLAGQFSLELLYAKSQADLIRDLIGGAEVVLTYCDALSVDYLVTFLSNQAGKRTATVMHGYCPKNSHMFFLTHSQYFIANSRYSKCLAENSGLNNVLMAGPVSCINQVSEDGACYTDSFIVILNGGSFKEAVQDNIEMLRLAECLAQKIRLTYRIRYHPHDMEKTWHNNNSKWLAGISDSKENLLEAILNSAFMIVGSSSVLFDCIFMKKKIMKFSGNDFSHDDVVPEVVFKSEQDIYKVFDRIKNESIDVLVERKNTVIGVDDISDSYRRIFHGLLQEYVM